jgi:hypothetical protein
VANEATLIIPEVGLGKDVSWEEMERRLYQNFFIIREILNPGISTTQVIGLNKAQWTNGILTRFWTAT